MTEERLDRERLSALIARWAEATCAAPEEESRVPLRVLLGEAVDLAELVDAHFVSNTVDGRAIKGLDVVAGLGLLTAETATELRELQLALATVQARYLLQGERMPEAPLARAAQLTEELRAALSFLLEDGHHEAGAQEMARLREESRRSSSQDAMAMVLEGYAELAAHMTDALALIDFPKGSAEEALGVAQELRRRSAARLAGAGTHVQRDLLRLRHRLTSALTERMLNCRRAFRYVFREQPDIARRAGSEYERERRRARRAAGVTGRGRGSPEASKHASPAAARAAGGVG